MLYVKKVVSDKQMKDLKGYVASRVVGSVFFGSADHVDQSVCFEHATIVAAADFNEMCDLEVGFGVDSSECGEWLVDKIVSFLGSENSSLVLIEDFVGSPNDSVFLHDFTARMWCYRDTILWPIQKDMANAEACQNTLAWAAGGPQVIFFCCSAELNDLSIRSDRFMVSESVFDEIRSSLRYLILDIFDSQGYVVLPIVPM